MSRPPDRAAQPPRSLPAALLVAREELRASWRDRQTAVYTLLLPLVLYPVLFWAMIQGWLVVRGIEERTPVRVAVASTEGARVGDALVAALARGTLDAEEPERLPDAVLVERLPGRIGDAAAREALAPGAERGPERPPDALLLLGAGEEGPARLYHDGARSRSELALERARERVEGQAEALREERLAQRGLALEDVEPFQLDPTFDVARGQDLIAFVLSFVLPILVVVMTVMGAFFPAVDVSAGERERGTLETTLLLPVPRRAVHQGKILAVGASAVVACVLNLLALGLSAGHLLGMIAPQLELSTRLPLAALLAVLPLLCLFGFFAAAVLTGLASTARSFKEGQALLGPVQLVFILPAMAGALPALVFDWRLALVPIVNVVLAFRSLLRGELLPLEYLLTALSLLACAAAASFFAERMLARESRLFDAPRRKGRASAAPRSAP